MDVRVNLFKAGFVLNKLSFSEVQFDCCIFIFFIFVISWVVFRHFDDFSSFGVLTLKCLQCTQEGIKDEAEGRGKEA